MPRMVFLLAAVFLLALLASAQVSPVNKAVVSVINFSIFPSTISEGGTTDFYLVLANTGEVSSNASPRIYIYRSLDNALVGLLELSAQAIYPNSFAVVSSSFSTRGFSEGSYYAIANATYYASSSLLASTNSVNTIFSVNTAFALLPKSIKPTLGEIKFLKSLVLKEIVAGSGAIESITLKNSLSTEVGVEIHASGVPREWVSFDPPRAKLLPNEQQIIAVGLSIPDNAAPGDYLVKIKANNSKASGEDFTVIRVKPRPKGDNTVVLRTVLLDREEKATLVRIRVINPTPNSISLFRLQDEVIPELTTDSTRIVFLDKPGAVVGGAPLKVVWELSDLAPQESTIVTYSIGATLNEYSRYTKWPLLQVALPQEISVEDLIRVKEISIPPLKAGGKGRIKVSVLYVGTSLLRVQVIPEVPRGFLVFPRESSEVLAPGGTTEVYFDVTAPRGSEGSHLVSILFSTDLGTTTKTSFLLVEGERISFLGGITRFLQSMMGGYLSLIIIILGLLALFLLALFIGSRKHSRRKRFALGGDYMNRLKKEI